MRPRGLWYVSTFCTTLVKKSQQANEASELREHPPTFIDVGQAHILDDAQGD
jgi:hypothetical protein